MMPKILIISSDTGGGHRSAALAISKGVKKFWMGKSVAVRIVRAIEDSHRLSKRLVNLYNWILANKQHWMKYFYWVVNRLRPEKNSYLLNNSIGYLKALFEKWCPHIVVSVHPLTQHVFARILKELNLADQVPLVTVVTDPCYGFWKGWACDDVSLYLVANSEAKRQLIDYGIRPKKIKISGMPIDPKFCPVDDIAARSARRELGLDEDKFTVFVNAGWAGGGNIPKIFKELIKGELDIQAVFLAGKNEALCDDATRLAESAHFPVKVIGYSDDVEKIMQSANVMISKLGGLTTFEAIACHLPIIADITTPPMPQEAGTASLISKRGAGRLLECTTDIVPMIENLLYDGSGYSQMREAVIRLCEPNSTNRIITEIAALLPDGLESVTPDSALARV